MVMWINPINNLSVVIRSPALSHIHSSGHQSWHLYQNSIPLWPVRKRKRKKKSFRWKVTSSGSWKADTGFRNIHNEQPCFYRMKWAKSLTLKLPAVSEGRQSRTGHKPERRRGEEKQPTTVSLRSPSPMLDRMIKIHQLTFMLSEWNLHVITPYSCTFRTFPTKFPTECHLNPNSHFKIQKYPLTFS